MPAVSICIPAYNGGAYLVEAIASALAQSFRDIEVLVVDDGSSDGSDREVEALQLKDPRLRLVRNPTNLGILGNFNRCIELSTGRYLKFLCDDDVLAPGCVDALVAELEAHPEVALATTARAYIDENGDPLRVVRFFSERRQIRGDVAARDIFFRRNLVGEPTAALMRRADALVKFKSCYRQAFDVDLWLRLLDRGDLVILPQPLCSIRIHPRQVTAANLRSGRVVHDKRILFQQFARRFSPASLFHRAFWDLRMASSVARAASDVGRGTLSSGVDETYFPRVFRNCLVPLVRAAYRLREHKPAESTAAR